MMKKHKNTWFIKKAQAVANISIEAGKTAGKAPWPASSLILARAMEECYQIAGESQFYDATVKSNGVTTNG